MSTPTTAGPTPPRSSLTALPPEMRRWAPRVLGGLMFCGVCVAFLPYFFATSQMKSFCAAVPADVSPAALSMRAQAAGYEVYPQTDGRLIIEDTPSLGRRQCIATFEGDTLRAATFNSN